MKNIKRPVKKSEGTFDILQGLRVASGPNVNVIRLQWYSLTATSGDTGSAAARAFSNLANVQITVLMPYNRCTDIQRRQMTTVEAKNVHLFESWFFVLLSIPAVVDGNSDELDQVLEQIYADSNFIKKHHVTSANSLNWARVCTQIAHYFYAYFNLGSPPGVTFAVPTGAAGNITAGYLAAKLGLPIKLIACGGPNRVVQKWLDTGILSKCDDVVKSLAPAMDIQVPYNVERIIWLASGGDAKLVNSIMTEYECNNQVKVPTEVMHKVKSVIPSGHTVSDNDILNSIEDCYKKHAYLLCPHSATAYSYWMGMCKVGGQLNDHPTVCIATAAPDKFLNVYQLLKNRFENDPSFLKMTLAANSERLGSLYEMRQRNPVFCPRNEMDGWSDLIRKHIESL